MGGQVYELDAYSAHQFAASKFAKLVRGRGELQWPTV